MTITTLTPRQRLTLRIYDNGGKSYDRYTAVFMDRLLKRQAYERPPYGYAVGYIYEALGFNDDPFHPLGFGQHTSAMPGRHLGKRVTLESLPEKARKFVLQNI